MTDDIVARLREWSDNAKEQDAIDIVVGLCAAADEIERLRKERDEAEPLLNELWERRTEATEMRSEIERLRAERDEARRMWCEAAPVGNYLSVDGMDRRARAEAKRRGWDCFKEEKHGKTTMG